MKFDICVGNPPYSGSLHLDIISSVLPFMSKRATGCFIHPAKWLIDVRKYGKRGEFGRVNSSDIKIYDTLKKKLDGHVKSINIENYNKEFGTERYDPYCITNIDMNKEYYNIDFTCCGEHKIVKSLYDCNMIGDYKTIWSIFDKVHSYGDMIKNHITKKDMGDGYWYIKYANIVGSTGSQLCSSEQQGVHYDNDKAYRHLKCGDYVHAYTTTLFHRNCYDITDTPQYTQDSGGHITDKIADNIYGTKQELENWRHFIFNNKLPLFLNIVLTVDQNNVSQEFIPWLVDKKYTDEEINEKFGFTKDEIKLIDDTLKKFERHSPWFKRYICGREDPNEVTTIEDSSKKKKNSTKSDSSPSGSEPSKTVLDN